MASPGTGGRPSLAKVTASWGRNHSRPFFSAASLKAIVFGVDAYGSCSNGKRWSLIICSTRS
jgi:hypothetical protein